MDDLFEGGTTAAPAADPSAPKDAAAGRAVLAQGTTRLGRRHQGARPRWPWWAVGAIALPLLVALVDLGGKGEQARAILGGTVAILGLGLCALMLLGVQRGLAQMQGTSRSAAAFACVLAGPVVALLVPWALGIIPPWTAEDASVLQHLPSSAGGWAGVASAFSVAGLGLSGTTVGASALWLLLLLVWGLTALVLLGQQAERARQLLLLVVAIGAIHAGISIVLAPFAPAFPGGGYSGRVRGTFVSPNEAVAFWSLLLPSALLLWARYGAPWGWCLAALTVAVIGSGSRGGVLSAGLVVLPLAWLLLPPRRRWAWGLLGLVGLAIAGAAINLQPLQGRFAELAQEHAQAHEITLSGRVSIWRASLPLIAEAGPWGTGPGTTMLAWRRAGDTTFEPQPLGHLHSDPLEALLESGWAGTTVLLVGWVLAAILVLGRLPPERWRRSAVLGPLLGLATFLIHSGADFLFENEAIVLTALLLVVVVIVTATAPEDAPLGHTARILRRVDARTAAGSEGQAAAASGAPPSTQAPALAARADGPGTLGGRWSMPGLLAGLAGVGALLVLGLLPWEIARARADAAFTTTARLVTGPEATSSAAHAASAELLQAPLASLPTAGAVRCPYAVSGLAGDARLLALRAGLDCSAWEATSGSTEDTADAAAPMADRATTMPASPSEDPRGDAAACLQRAALACPAEPRAWLARARLALDLDHADGTAAADCLERALTWAPAWMYGAQEAYALLARDEATAIPAARRKALLQRLLGPDLPVPLTAAVAARRDLGEPALEALLADGHHERTRASLVGYLRVHGSCAAWRRARATDLRLHPRALAPSEVVVGMLRTTAPPAAAGGGPATGRTPGGATTAPAANPGTAARPEATEVPPGAPDDDGSAAPDGAATVAIAPSALERMQQSTSLQEAGLPIPDALAQALRNDGNPWSLWAMPLDCFEPTCRERLRRLGDAGERWAQTWVTRAELAARVSTGDTSLLTVSTDPVLLQGALRALAEGTVRTTIPGEVDRIRLACARYHRPTWASIPGVTWAWVEEDDQTPPVVVTTSGWMGLVVDGTWRGWRRGSFDVRPLLTPGLHRVDLIDG